MTRPTLTELRAAAERVLADLVKIPPTTAHERECVALATWVRDLLSFPLAANAHYVDVVADGEAPGEVGISIWHPQRDHWMDPGRARCLAADLLRAAERAESPEGPGEGRP